MDCPHCKKVIDWAAVLQELRLALGAAVPAQNERAELITWLTSWRENCGLPAITLTGRSTAQLRKAFAEAQVGKQYRLGRKWKVVPK